VFCLLLGTLGLDIPFIQLENPLRNGTAPPTSPAVKRASYADNMTSFAPVSVISSFYQRRASDINELRRIFLREGRAFQTARARGRRSAPGRAGAVHTPLVSMRSKRRTADPRYTPLAAQRLTHPGLSKRLRRCMPQQQRVSQRPVTG
jgi:hypothetical protein